MEYKLTEFGADILTDITAFCDRNVAGTAAEADHAHRFPAEMYEAAAIDGASNTRQFFTITIPLLGPVLQMVLMNAVLGSLKVTDLVLTLTNGRPNGKTEVMMTYIYKYFFQQDGGNMQKQYGYGAALTVVTAVMLTLVTLVYLRATKKSSEIY